jgi:DUF4097 and DUF4098 domain-containing protein YvlB
MRRLAHSSARLAGGTDALVCQSSGQSRDRKGAIFCTGATSRARGIGARIAIALVSLALPLAILVPHPLFGQQPLKHEGDSWVRTYTGSIPAAARLRVNGHGPVTLTAGVGREIGYTVKVSVMARTEAEARRMLDRESIHAEVHGDSAVLTTPGGAAMSTTVIRAPRLTLASISTTNGAVEVRGVDGSLDVDSGGGALTCDRVRGDCKLITGGGDIHVGEVGGQLRCGTGGGHITVKSVGGRATLQTIGGDIEAAYAGGPLSAETGAGEVHIASAKGTVDATTGGGQIVVDKASGIVTARNMAGPVRIGEAAGVSCESHSGGIHLTNVSGLMRVSTSVGSIFASLMAGRLADSFLATGNGDITVVIPSNVGVNIRAVNNMADNMKRIVSDFRQVQARLTGTRLVAEGAVNGGGPLLQINGTGGTIFIKRQ